MPRFFHVKISQKNHIKGKNLRNTREGTWQMSRYLKNACVIGSVYLLCEVLKLLFLDHDAEDYELCVRKLQIVKLSMPTRWNDEKVFETCARTEHMDTLQTFANDFVKAVAIIHCLFGAIMDREIGVNYWIVSHASALAFTYMETMRPFQFSYDSDMTYTKSTVFITCAWVGIMVPFMIWNVARKKIATCYVILYSSYYIVSYGLLFSGTDDIMYHFHHSFVCTLLSYFCIDWSSQVNMYAHAMFLGVAIHGLSFYKFDEYSLLNISYDVGIGCGQIAILYVYILLILFINNVTSKIKNKNSGQEEDD